MPGRIRVEDLTKAQRAQLGIRTHTPKKGRGTAAGTTWCVKCGATCAGWAAIDRHQRETGHSRYEAVRPPPGSTSEG